MENGMLMPHSYISGPDKKRIFNFIINHPWMSFAGAGIVAAAAYVFTPPLNLEVTLGYRSDSPYAREIVLPDSISIPEPYFPIEDEQITSSEPASDLEEVADSEQSFENTFNYELEWSEYREDKQKILEKQGVNKNNYDDVREGRLVIKPQHSNN
jgi:hypothetical protein